MWLKMPTRTPGGVARVDYGKKLEAVMDDFDKAMEPGVMFSRGGSLNAADAAQYSDGGVMFSRGGFLNAADAAQYSDGGVMFSRS